MNLLLQFPQNLFRLPYNENITIISKVRKSSENSYQKSLPSDVHQVILWLKICTKLSINRYIHSNTFLLITIE